LSERAAPAIDPSACKYLCRFSLHCGRPQDDVSLVLSGNAQVISRYGITSLIGNRLPEGIDPGTLHGELREKAPGDDLGNNLLSLDVLPASAREFFNQSYELLSNAVQHVLGVIAWRENLAIPPFYARAAWPEWSENEVAWKRVPANFRMAMGVINFLGNAAPAEVGLLLGDPASGEPLSSELWREAWNLRGQNSRSSLMMGVAALETGIKELIGSVVPDAAWLVENLPSPPVHSLMADYLPQLELLQSWDGGRLRIPAEIIQICRKRIGQRNEIVHGRRSGVRSEDLEEFLLLVRDLLRIFDVSLGREWARRFVRTETGEKLSGS
ncbi:MAG TPA: hypothetical protein VLK66_18420, partial [Longimicrobium sp.]